MNLWDPKTVRQIMAMFGLNFRRELGQNFLTDPEVIDAIADACHPTGDCTVLEIGPGIGTLTRSLAARCRQVIALEIDRSLIPVLHYTLADCPNVTVVNGDVMQTDLASLLEDAFRAGPVAVCANLPYYITTPILMKLLESRLSFAGITVMVQAEVADRLCAGAGGKAYGAITVALNYYGSAREMLSVPADRFVPAPKVNSKVTKITLWREKPFVPKDEEMLFCTVRAAFGQRRKTLANALSAGFPELGKERIARILGEMELPPDIRGERLDIGRFTELSDRLLQACGGTEQEDRK